MDGDHLMENDRQGILNQISLDLLLRRLGTTVLRRKFREIYAKLNNGQEWTDGPSSGKKFCQSKWGKEAFLNAQRKQQEMMTGGNIHNWDLNCLQSVITQMLTAALNDNEESSSNSCCKKGPNSQRTPVNWDPKWGNQMSKIRKLANIRHSIAHMPHETLPQGEFDDTWSEAVEALKGLGAKTKEIKDIRQMTQFAFNPPVPEQQSQGQGQLPNDSGDGQKDEGKEKIEEERKTIEELRARIKKLKLERQTQIQNEVTNQKDEIKSQLTNKTAYPKIANKKNETRASSLIKRGDLASRTGDWDKALEFYTQALDIPDISDDLRKKTYMNRSWVHLKIILQRSKLPFNLNFSELGELKSESKNGNGKIPSKSHSASTQRESKFVDEKLLEMNHRKWPEKLTEELKEFHLTAGIADAESALRLSPDQSSSKTYYRLAQFHQLKGNWNSALTFFDLALDQSDVDDAHLEFDRNVCQLEVLNQTEVEEFPWIPGKKNQTMAGLVVRRDPQKWKIALEKEKEGSKEQLFAQLLKAHFLAMGSTWDEEENQESPKEQKVSQQLFDDLVDLYEGAANGGLPSGFYNLGILLQEGNGVQKDFTGAVRLFEMAAQFSINDTTPDWIKDGILEAQYRLGLCYEFGLGVGKDEKRALHWYEMASLGNYGKASRKLGNIYSQGLLGVAKDTDMAFFCWKHAAAYGDTLAQTSAALHPLQSSPVTWTSIGFSLDNYSDAVYFNFVVGTPTMMSTVLSRKQHFQTVLATVLEDLAQEAKTKKEGETRLGFGLTKNEEKEREPEGASWNIPAFVDHTLRTIHLLELVQTPGFQQKLEATPNWRKQFTFTGRLVEASNACMKGLAAFKELNKLYVETVIKASEPGIKMDYPPDLQVIPDLDPATLERETQLLTVILESFADSIQLVGAVYFRDHMSQFLIDSLLARRFESFSKADKFNWVLLYTYFQVLKDPGVRWEGGLKVIKEISWERGAPFFESLFAISGAAVLGTLGKFEEATGYMEEALKHLGAPFLRPGIVKLNCDLLFVQALCCKSAAVTHGINSTNRKKIKEAKAIFQKFLQICPKDEPRRADAHYQLGLCTLYLEKMMVKGQVNSSIAKDILEKILPLFNQGEAVEQEFPWKELHCPDKSSVKMQLQQQIKELKNLIKKVSAQNLTSDCEGEKSGIACACVGKFLDPYFKFPTSSLALKLREKWRIMIITQFRRFFKAAHSDLPKGSSPSPLIDPHKWDDLLEKPGSPCIEEHVTISSQIMGFYEVIEPIVYARFQQSVCKHMKGRLDVDKIDAFTVVQDESGAIYNLQLTIQLRHDKDIRRIGEFMMGARIIIHRPILRIEADGRQSLIVGDADVQVHHLPLTFNQQQQPQGKEEPDDLIRKCGFCGEIGGMFQRCSRCKIIYYCGKECQTADWNELKHKWICPFLKYQPPPFSTLPAPGI